MENVTGLENASNLARFYIFRFNEACEKFCNDEIEEGEDICRELLLNPDLPLGLRAGSHTKLAYGNENYLWHARQAVYFWDQIVRERPDNLRYERALERSRALVELAEQDREDEEARDNTDITGQVAQPPGDENVGQADVPSQYPQVVIPAHPLKIPTALVGHRTTSRVPPRRVRTSDSGYLTAGSERPPRTPKKPERYGFE